ncbi:maleylpyruvate isomerase family mycothiol-dependent enzyme, partial [Nocardia tengchongensis]
HPRPGAGAPEPARPSGCPGGKPHRRDGIRLSATDIDWTHGSGSEIRGPILALLLLVTGRTAALDRVAGEGIPRLARQLA